MRRTRRNILPRMYSGSWDARWSHLQDHAKRSTIGKLIDDAMLALEASNASLKGVLPKEYARPALNKIMLGELIDLISGFAMGEDADRSKDIWGGSMSIFWAALPGRKASEAASSIRPVPWSAFWSRCWNPTRAGSTIRVAGPAAFVQSESSCSPTAGGSAISPFVGQESNYTTWRLCRDESGRARHRRRYPMEQRGSFHWNEAETSGPITFWPIPLQYFRLGRAFTRRRAVEIRRSAGGQRQLRVAQHIVHHWPRTATAGVAATMAP